MTDLQQQLAHLLGQDVRQIRKTDESPARIAVIDVVAAITGLSSNGNSNAALAFARLKHDHPEVTAGCSDYKFPGRRQRNTPVTGVRGIVEIIMLMPGHQAARVRCQAAEGGGASSSSRREGRPTRRRRRRRPRRSRRLKWLRN